MSTIVEALGAKNVTAYELKDLIVEVDNSPADVFTHITMFLLDQHLHGRIEIGDLFYMYTEILGRIIDKEKSK